MPLTYRRAIAVAFAKQRRSLRKELARAIELKTATHGEKWEPAESAKRRLFTLNTIIEEWRNKNDNRQ